MPFSPRNLFSLFGLALCFSYLSFSGVSQEPTRRAPKRPVLKAASDEGQKALETFRIPAGLKASLFAAEPQVGNPVAFGVDRLGNVFVCESYRQNNGVTDNRSHDDKWLDADLAAMSVEDRIKYHRELLGKEADHYEKYDDLIRVLRDTDKDGVADKSTIFSFGYNGIEEGTGAGVLIRDDQVYFTNIPHLWSIKDKDGDFVADQRQALHSGFGIRVAFRGHDLHGLIIGPDGRLYFSIGDRGYAVQTGNGKLFDPESGAVFRCELDGSNLEVFATGLRNPQELAFDDYGNLFTGDNNSDSGDRARWVQLVQGGDSGWRMMYQYLPDRGPFNREKIWYPYGPETPAYIVPPIANLSDGPSGLVCYPGVGLDGSEDLQGSFFLCDFRGQASNSGIRRIKLAPKGATFEVAKNEEYVWNVLATDADFAPDGSLLLSDWVNGWNGENKGRIYRIAAESKEIANAGAESARLLQEGFTHRSTDDLVTLLSNSDRRIRLEAQWELARRDSVTSFANILASDAKGFEKLHAVWGLGQIVRKSKKDQNKQAIQLLLDSLNSLDEYVVARACEVLSETNGVIRGEQLSQLVLHQSSVVRAQAMMAVGKQKAAECLESVAKALMENADRDPIIRHAGIMAFAGALSGESAQWLKHSHESVRIAVAVGLRKAKNPLIAKLLTDESLRVVREAVRAIYDVPELQSQLAELADMTIEDGHDPNIVKRILHANYRLGTPKHASRLIQFATSKLGTDSLRAEAMRLLGDWAKPGLRDRIMNRHSPIPDRDASFIAKILQENIDTLAATPKVVRNEFLKVGAKLKINGITKLLEAIVQDASAEPARRASSIKALSQIQPEKLLEQRDTLLKDSSPTVRIAMMNAVADLSPAKALDSIQSALRSESMQERQAAWDLLGKNQALDSDKVQKLIDDQITQLLSESFPKDTLLNAVEATVNKGSEASKKTINEWTASRDSLLQTKPRDAYIDCLEGGDIENGRELFFTRSNLSCVRCHKIGETGGDVGPNLSAIGKQKDRGYLAEAIVAPDAAIALGFETVVILTEDDENYSGILKSEDAEKLNIMDAQGKVLSIDKTVIAARKKGLSSMPAGLMKFLNRRELRDLVAYMASLDGTPEATIKYGEIGGHQVE